MCIIVKIENRTRKAMHNDISVIVIILRSQGSVWFCQRWCNNIRVYCTRAIYKERDHETHRRNVDSYTYFGGLNSIQMCRSRAYPSRLNGTETNHAYVLIYAEKSRRLNDTI